ncbi:DUF4224 domain-containing protein [Ectopseudomonas mendocina]|nr:DUF4224 domain-containing protein [Pseudomonas mendocina]TRO21991.1 DUF4224 domain-containing protein [Pseudomonas mendocina]TRO29357.1 DUF4224 domain-containing protein [Pseudomonas mendocina]
MSEPAEFLTEDELAAMICAKSARKQMQWLDSHGWRYERNAAGKPIVGRIYARLKLAGVRPTESTAVAEPWQIDLSKVS